MESIEQSNQLIIANNPEAIREFLRERVTDFRNQKDKSIRFHPPGSWECCNEILKSINRPSGKYRLDGVTDPTIDMSAITHIVLYKFDTLSFVGKASDNILIVPFSLDEILQDELAAS